MHYSNNWDENSPWELDILMEDAIGYFSPRFFQLGPDNTIHAVYEYVTLSIYYIKGSYQEPGSALNPQGESLFPGSVELADVSPNPSPGIMKIRYSIGSPAYGSKRDVSFRIVDLHGRSIYKSEPQSLSEGLHSADINLHANSGTRINSGVYFLVINATNPVTQDERRLVIIR